MQARHLSILLGVAAVLAAAIGWLRPSAERRDSQPASALDSVIAEVRRFGSPAAGASARRGPDARATFLRRHRGEIDNSFSVAGAVVADSLAVGLVRYSIGSSVYHDVRWLRRVDGAWYPTDPPASSPSDTGVAVDSLGPAATRWLKEGDPRWW